MDAILGFIFAIWGLLSYEVFQLCTDDKVDELGPILLLTLPIVVIDATMVLTMPIVGWFNIFINLVELVLILLMVYQQKHV